MASHKSNKQHYQPRSTWAYLVPENSSCIHRNLIPQSITHILYAYLMRMPIPMKQTQHSARTKKRPTNLSIRTDLLERAKQLNINLSAAFELFLEQHLAQQHRQAWQEKNQPAIEDYNQQVAKRGVFSKGRRQF